MALAARLVAWRWQPWVAVDGSSYIALARTLFGGALYPTQQPPGYPFLIALALPLTPGGATPEGGVLAARVVSLVCGLGFLCPFFLLARRALGGERPALVATLLLALTPLALRYAVTTTSESPYLLALLGAFAALAAERDLPAGLLFGLAFLARPEGLVVAAGAGLARLLGARLGPPAAAGAGAPPAAPPATPTPAAYSLVPRPAFRPRPALLLAAGFLLAGLLPALLFNHRMSGEWVLTRKGINLRSETLWANEPTPEETARGGRAAVPLASRLTRNGEDIARNWPGRTLRQVVNLGGAVGWGATLGLLALFAGGSWLLGAALLPLVVTPLFLGVPMEPRFVFPLVPFAGLIAGRAALGLPAPPRRLALALVVGGWLLATALGLPDLARHEGEAYPELVRAGQALRAVTTPGTLFFDRKPFVGYYAGGRTQTPPLGPYMESVDAMVTARGDYLVLHQFVTKTFRPALMPLLEDPCVMLGDPRLTLVYFDTAVPSRRVAVYRINRPGVPPVPREIFGALWDQVRQTPCDDAQAALHERLARLGREP